MLSREPAVTITHGLELRLLCSRELEEAAQLVGRGMRDNPSNMRVFHIADGEHRSIAMGRFFVPVLRGLHRRGLVLGAILSNRLVGICGMARPALDRTASSVWRNEISIEFFEMLRTIKSMTRARGGPAAIFS